GPASAASRLVELTRLLESTTFANLADTDELGRRPGLESFVGTVRAQLASISNEISAESFTRLQSQHSMGGPIDHRRPLGASGSLPGSLPGSLQGGAT
ncbi:MAG: hypothetical protein ACI9N0_002473, partial [Ilumatobacter sp.]